MVIKIKNKFAIKIESNFEWDYWQINTPFIGVYKSDGAGCLIINIMFFEVQFWLGDVEYLI